MKETEGLQNAVGLSKKEYESRFDTLEKLDWCESKLSRCCCSDLSPSTSQIDNRAQFRRVEGARVWAGSGQETRSSPEAAGEKALGSRAGSFLGSGWPVRPRLHRPLLPHSRSSWKRGRLLPSFCAIPHCPSQTNFSRSIARGKILALLEGRQGRISLDEVNPSERRPEPYWCCRGYEHDRRGRSSYAEVRSVSAAFGDITKLATPCGRCVRERGSRHLHGPSHRAHKSDDRYGISERRIHGDAGRSQRQPPHLVS